MREEKTGLKKKWGVEKRGNDMEQCRGRKKYHNALNDDILYTGFGTE